MHIAKKEYSFFYSWCHSIKSGKYSFKIWQKDTLHFDNRIDFTPELWYTHCSSTSNNVESRWKDGTRRYDARRIKTGYDWLFRNLQRIKKADTGNNPELEYQLKIYKNKLSSLGVPSEEYEM